LKSVWRTVYAEFATDPLSTEGARLYSARYHTGGHEVLYTAETESLSRLERLVHLTQERAIEMVLIEIGLPDEAVIEVAESLPCLKAPFSIKDEKSTRELGDWWCDNSQALGLSIPSLHSTTELNILLARRSPLYRKLQVVRSVPFVFDARLVRGAGAGGKALKKSSPGKHHETGSRDRRNPEDVDTSANDHALDATSYLIAGRSHGRATMTDFAGRAPVLPDTGRRVVYV
jgi:RES domain-containing protein